MWRSRLLRNALISLFIANVLILIGKDNWLPLYQMPLHYVDMLVTFISVLIVFEYVDWVNRYLNRQLQITGDFRRRVLLQIVMGVIAPALLAIVLTFLMWEFLWHQDLVADGYFKHEFFPQFLIILIVNLFFVVSDLFRRVTKTTADQGEVITLLAQSGPKKVPVSPDSVSFIHLKNGLVYLVLLDGEQLLLPSNLDAFEKMLPRDEFFRANRQVILNRKACRAFKSVGNGKIEVELQSSADPVVVSQKRAASFRSWMNQ